MLSPSSASIAVLFAISLASPKLFALAGGDVAITLASSPDVVIDSNNECINGPGATTIIVAVANTSGAAISGISATLQGLDAFSLLDSPTRALGELAAGEEQRVAWRVAVNTATCTDGTSDALVVSVDDGTGAVTGGFTLALRSAIAANAGGAIESQTIVTAEQAVGGTGSVDVTYSFGGVTPGETFNLQPAGNPTALGACSELVGMEIRYSDLPLDIPLGTLDQSYFVAVDTSNGTGHLVTVRHTFRSLCSGSTTVLPFASQASGGTNHKYSGNYGACFAASCEQTFPTAAETVTGSLSVNPTQAAPGEAVQFNYELTNTSNAAAFVDGITLTLPAGATFVSHVSGPACGGTDQLTSDLSDVEPLAGSSGVQRFMPHISRMGIPAYEVQGMGTLRLCFTVTVNSLPATVTAEARIGNTTSGPSEATVAEIPVAPTIAKSFSPDSIAVGGTSTLTFIVTNPNAGTALTGVAFTDSFPAGLEVAATPAATSTGCGAPTFAPSSGNTTVSFSGGTIAASGTCTVTVDVTATTGGAKVNTTGNVTSTNGGTGNTATDTLTVLGAPGIAKVFSPDSIAIGGASTLTFTVTNPNAGTSLTGVAFTDSFPAGLEVAAAPGATTTGCGSPTFAPASGNTTVSFSGGTLAASGTCTVTVDVTATTGGAKVNTTGNVTSTNGGTGNTATDTLTVLAAPGIAKSFSPSSIAVGGTSTLTFTVTNPNAGSPLTGVAFTDSFPAGLEVAATPAATSTGCGAPTFAPASGNTTVSFSGGTIAASGTCSVTVDVTATTGGAKVNTTGNVTSTNGGTGNAAMATLEVGTAPVISKVFAPDPIQVGGVTTLSFTIVNPNPGIILTGVSFTDSFPAGLQVAATPNVTTTGCGSPAFAPVAGNTSVTFSGGTIAASGTCNVTVDVSATTAGALVNTTGSVTSTNGGSGNTATATLTVLAPPAITKVFSPDSIAVGGTSSLSFTITNPNASTALAGVGFSDPFPAGVQVAASPGATTTGCGSPAFAPAAGDTSLTFSGGTVAASGTCTVTVSVTATTAGSKVNTTGNVTSTNGGTGNTATDTLLVATPQITVTKSSTFAAANDLDGSGGLSPGDTLVYTVLVSNTGGAEALLVTLTDSPDPNTALVVGSVTTTQGTVTTGNASGATTVAVNLGTIPASGQASVTFTVTIDNPMPPGVTSVSNQALVQGDNFPQTVSDDATTGAPGDPTANVVSAAAVPIPTAAAFPIPTASEWGVMILGLMLAFSAAWRLRN